MARKRQSSIRLSDEGYAIRDALSVRLGISGTGVIEQALRVLAAREGVTLGTKAGTKGAPKTRAKAK